MRAKRWRVINGPSSQNTRGTRSGNAERTSRLGRTRAFGARVVNEKISEKRRQRSVVSAITWTTRSEVRSRSEIELAATLAAIDEDEVCLELVLIRSVRALRGVLAGVGGGAEAVLAAVVARVAHLFIHLTPPARDNCQSLPWIRSSSRSAVLSRLM